MKLLSSFFLLCIVVSVRGLSPWECAAMCNNKANAAVCGCLEVNGNMCKWFDSMCILESCASEFELKPNSHCDLNTKPKTTINDGLPVPPNNGNGRRQR